MDLPKLLAIDLDGTLLNSQGTISETNKRSVQWLYEHGTTIVIATGRTIHSARKMLEILEVEGYAITLNGALTFDAKEMEPLFKEVMNTPKIKELVPELEGKKINIYFNTVDASYVYIQDQELMAYYGHSNELVGLESLEDEKLQQETFTKLLLSTKDLSLLETYRLKFSSYFEAVYPDPHCIELTRTGVHKGKALKQLAQRLNIPLSDVAAIGDSQNDLEMLKVAGYSIVMGQATDEIKEQASFVTKSHDDDGLAYAVKSLFKK